MVKDLVVVVKDLVAKFAAAQGMCHCLYATKSALNNMRASRF